MVIGVDIDIVVFFVCVYVIVFNCMIEYVIKVYVVEVVALR